MYLHQYLRQNLSRFCMNPAGFCGLEDTPVAQSSQSVFPGGT
jgi:hypothetical protein